MTISKALLLERGQHAKTKGLVEVQEKLIEALTEKNNGLEAILNGFHLDSQCGSCNGPLEESRDAICRRCSSDTYIKYQNKHIAKLEHEIYRLGGTVKDRGEAIVPLSCSMFGGKYSDQYNALWSALTTAAKEAGFTGEYCEYEWIEKTPRTSLIVNLVDALHLHGYEIKKR